MSAVPLILELPQPCPESWDAMTPTGAGRHCAACQQVVIDFTAFTDGELAAYLSQPAPLPCGRFRESQLNRVLLPTAAPVAGWRRWLGAVVALLGLGSLATSACSQPTLGKLAPTQTQPPKRATQPIAQADSAAPAPPTHRPERVLGGAPLRRMPIPPSPTQRVKK